MIGQFSILWKIGGPAAEKGEVAQIVKIIVLVVKPKTCDSQWGYSFFVKGTLTFTISTGFSMFRQGSTYLHDGMIAELSADRIFWPIATERT